MKKVLMAALLISSISTASFANTVTPSISNSISAEWMKSKTQTWEGMVDGKTYWYKLDKSAKLWWSTDGTKWASVDSQSWMDKEGKWLKIHEGKLVWSADGKEWSEVPEWKWEGSNGTWYKFDKKWTLWTNK